MFYHHLPKDRPTQGYFARIAQKRPVTRYHLRMARRLSTVEQAVRLLEYFDADHTEWTLSDLARQCGQPTSTVHQQLVTLSMCGLLTQVGRGRYQLGLRLLKLASALYGSRPWYSPAHTAMDKVARSTHLLAFIAVRQGEQVICVARSVQGRGGAEVVGETSFELPPHATASGKLLYALAGLDFAESAPRFTPYTLRQPWAQEAAEIRRTRAAVTCDEWAIGTSSLAVPFVDADGAVLGTLGLSLPTSRLREQDQLLRRLREEAEQIP